MTATVESIRTQIDRLAPDEARELFAALQHDYAVHLMQDEERALDMAELTEADRAKIEALRQDVQHAADQLDRGEGSEMDWEAFLTERHRAHAARPQAS